MNPSLRWTYSIWVSRDKPKGQLSSHANVSKQQKTPSSELINSKYCLACRGTAFLVFKNHLLVALYFDQKIQALHSFVNPETGIYRLIY